METIPNCIDKHFFIIDSENLNNVKSKLYGYSIIGDGEVIFDEDLADEIELTGEGTYVNVSKKQDSISISQDFNGSFGIYIYKHPSKKRFVISNSFKLLVDYIKDKCYFSLNWDAVYSFIPSDLCSIVYKQTMINEIIELPNNRILNIDLNTNEMSFEETDYKFDSVEIDSEEGLKILDQWFFKWISIIRNLYKSNKYLQVDLTGGFDSRIVFTLFLYANINLNKIRIHSKTNSVFSEDYEIASIFSDKYNFNLNSDFPFPAVKLNTKDSINLLYAIKLGYHKQFSFPKSINLEPKFIFGGFGGESLREYWNITSKEYIDSCTKRASHYSKDFITPVQNIIKKTITELKNDFSLEDDSKKITELLYREVRSRNHFGKNSVSFYVTNQIQMAPLLDHNLYKLKKISGKENLLFALIFVRYFPELLEIKFDNNKKLDESLIDYAHEINKKYPLKSKNFNYLDRNFEGIVENNKSNLKKNECEVQCEPDKFIKEIFLSKQFKKSFEIYFSSDLYRKILNEMNTKSLHPLSLVNCSIAVLYFIKSANYNNELFLNNDWFDNFFTFKYFEEDIIDSDVFDNLIKYNTARFDLKNIGDSNNSIEISNISDSFSNVMMPPWFSDEKGRGTVIESHANEIKIKLKCVGDGKLNILLRSKYFTDKNRNNFPIYIDYISFSVNGEEIIESNKVVHIFNPISYEKNVKNGEIIELQIKWKPFNKNSI